MRRTSIAKQLLTYSSDFGAARLDSCELRTVVPYTYTLSERSAELHAELPVKEEDPVLYEIVKKGMVHGPCGALNPNSPRLRDSKSTKQIPKSFQSQTSTSDGGYPKYRRRCPEQDKLPPSEIMILTTDGSFPIIRSF
ncbi:hypothetical protein EVAR_50516_1 [Eumeta japonica]|uniref:Uncharacterized protein n=1 Tax=Eumeta variegata TaxID=151549 RepID=A0A4C1X924_EUMVA|nr:hypothetical protein EVAR_50516_1 [Eumeta japonica]